LITNQPLYQLSYVGARIPAIIGVWPSLSNHHAMATQDWVLLSCASPLQEHSRQKTRSSRELQQSQSPTPCVCSAPDTYVPVDSVLLSPRWVPRKGRSPRDRTWSWSVDPDYPAIRHVARGSVEQGRQADAKRRLLCSCQALPSVDCTS
jgi:hypothetical protein